MPETIEQVQERTAGEFTGKSGRKVQAFQAGAPIVVGEWPGRLIHVAQNEWVLRDPDNGEYLTPVSDDVFQERYQGKDKPKSEPEAGPADLRAVHGARDANGDPRGQGNQNAPMERDSWPRVGQTFSTDATTDPRSVGQVGTPFNPLTMDAGGQPRPPDNPALNSVSGSQSPVPGSEAPSDANPTPDRENAPWRTEAPPSGTLPGHDS